jgi:small subunit ribosomal protein S8
MGDLISDALSNLMNAERIRRKEVIIKRTSKLLLAIVKIIKEKGYIKDFEFTPNTRGGTLKIQLNNKINKIGSIRPRYSCTLDKIESFEKVYLPAADFGIIIMSTPHGLITHYEAKNQKTGGVLVAYCY